MPKLILAVSSLPPCSQLFIPISISICHLPGMPPPVVPQYRSIKLSKLKPTSPIYFIYDLVTSKKNEEKKKINKSLLSSLRSCKNGESVCLLHSMLLIPVNVKHTKISSCINLGSGMTGKQLENMFSRLFPVM